MKKLTPADKLEAAIRTQYLPGQMAGLLSQIMEIETNALWRATPEGIKEAKEENEYTLEDIKTVLGKQAKRRAALLLKVDFIGRLYNEQCSKKKK